MGKHRYSKQYKQMMHKHKNNIRELAKDASINPWDYGHSLEGFVACLRFMRDYYALGENVWQTDETRIPALESLEKAIDAYNMWQYCENEYFISCPLLEAGFYLDQGFFLQDRSQLLGDHVFLTKYSTMKETADKFNVDYRARRSNFFKIVADNIERWWD